ncbi:hypothetical protein SIN09_30565, partial [Streptomyces sp. F8]|nr:hypothetical protein [Streptomyces sp. F8]
MSTDRQAETATAAAEEPAGAQADSDAPEAGTAAAEDQAATRTDADGAAAAGAAVPSGPQAPPAA